MKFNPNNLKRLMKKENINRSQLAERLGVSRATITRLLNSQFQPSTKMLSALKEKFPEISLDYFFTESVATECQEKAK